MSKSDDLERWFDEKIETLARDLMWRCQELDLTQRDYSAILIRSYSWPLAQIISLRSDGEGDHEALAVIMCMIQRARRMQQAHKKAEVER